MAVETKNPNFKSLHEIMFDGWWGDKSAYIKGPLASLKAKVSEACAKHWKVDTSERAKTPHIELLSATLAKSIPKDDESLKSISGNVIDVADRNNWERRRGALVLKTGHTIRAHATHMTMVYCNDWVTAFDADAVFAVIEEVLVREFGCKWHRE